MILELDAGNSRIKWRALEGDGGRIHCEGNAIDVAALKEDFDNSLAIDFVRLCSVRRDAAVTELEAWVNQRWKLGIEQATVGDNSAGITHQYLDDQRLGIDRWLAMLAAFHRAAGPCIIVDAGTALTIDVLDATGRHQGGYILPGLKLMRDSLQANTGIRLDPDYTQQSVALGHSTEAAVCNGSLALLLALIEKVLTEHSTRRIFLSGGDAQILADTLNAGGRNREASIEVVPGLVLDGLALACPQPAELA